MPDYDLLGLTVWIPDITDLTSFVVTPIQDWITQGLSDFVNGVVTGASELGGLFTAFFNELITQITDALGSTFNFITTGITSISNTLIGWGTTLESEVSDAFNTSWNALIAVGSSFYTTLSEAVSAGFQSVSGIVSTITDSVTAALEDPAGFLATLLQQIDTDVATAINAGLTGVTGLADSVSASFNSVILPAINASIGTVNNTLAQTSNALNNIGTYVTNSFNQLVNSINTAFATVGSDIVQAVNEYITAPAQTYLQTAINTVETDVVNLTNYVQQTFISLLPSSPQQAFNGALSLGVLSITATVASELTALVIEAIYPTKHWGVTEALQTTLEMTGILDLGGELYRTMIKHSFDVQLEYFFNQQLSPYLPEPNQVLKGVHYGVNTLQDYDTALVWEGYNQDARNSFEGTMYRPMPPFILEKLIELQVVSNDFSTKQLQMEGFDPADSAYLVQAFTNLAMNPFQSSAKSLVYSMFRDGLIDQSTASGIMSAFAVPTIQQSWVLTLANYEYIYQQKIKLQTYFLDLFKKGQEDSATTLTLLESLGMSSERAGVLIKITALTQAPTLPKADRAQILQDALNLNVYVAVS